MDLRDIHERQRMQGRQMAVMAEILNDAVRVVEPRLRRLDAPCLKTYEASILLQDAEGNQYVLAVRPVG